MWDGTSEEMRRFVEFSEGQGRAFEKFYREKKAVGVKQCMIKQAYGWEHKLEIIVTDRSGISECPIPIELPAGGIPESKFVVLCCTFRCQ